MYRTIGGRIENDAHDFSIDDTAVSNTDFADIMLDATLDDPSFEAEISAEFDRYIHRRRSKNYFEEDFDDDYDFD